MSRRTRAIKPRMCGWTESSVSIKDLSPCPSFDTSSRPFVETFADNVPESSVAEPGREHDMTAPPVVNEPDGCSSDVDHESAGDNTMPPRRSTRFRKAERKIWRVGIVVPAVA